MARSAPQQPKSRAWVVLTAFIGVVAVSQMLWLNFAPLLTYVQQRYGVSELRASLLVLVFPLLYVVLSIPAGWLTDRKGYHVAVGWGAAVTAVFSAVRLDDAHFG